ncbi:serine/threonine protein kinase [Cellulosimicrobium arenosum]|uniref:non-specific serine/threonine protein kinase n=2 Tax=Cellulosimicrobium arenosum TaxID=2708133 RepID=A0A927IWF5_9MICO|nr:RIO1 family regulatory kinase/ATPase [Cellulosimicrobium arenosum]MBD8077631.1 serine/threonine protein kinase [Cellulosimicrobium arenosum]
MTPARAPDVPDDPLPHVVLGALDATIGDDQRWSTWSSVQKGQRGPEPRPDWVVTAYAAVDTELGVLKTGKEADVLVVERAVPDDPAQRSVLAAKRYRGLDHRSFRRDTLYTEDRRVRRTRDRRALDRKSAYGREVAAGQWAAAEFAALGELWSAGVPVPYPVQIDGTEILMEFVGTSDEGVHEAAPRLARTRPDPDLLASWWDQLRDAMAVLARLGYAHGDLSPYNVLADDDRLVIIDLPQVVDLVANPFGTELLLRDCRTMAAWFTGRGLDADADELFAALLAQAW